MRVEIALEIEHFHCKFPMLKPLTAKSWITSPYFMRAGSSAGNVLVYSYKNMEGIQPGFDASNLSRPGYWFQAQRENCFIFRIFNCQLELVIQNWV